MSKLLASLITASFALPSLSFAQKAPSVLDSITAQGVEIVHTFDAPMGLKGYVGDTGGENVTFYVSPDESHLILGTMVDANGRNLSNQIIQEQVVIPKIKQYWEAIEDSAWVQDGSTDAPLVLYTFTDPNCPYCALFREQVDPWVQSEDIQLRHIMVGVIRESSLDKSAMILVSDKGAELLHEQQKNLRSGGIAVDPEVVSNGSMKVWENNNLMGDLGFAGTPVTVFKDESGQIQVIQGILDEARLEALKKGGF